MHLPMPQKGKAKLPAESKPSVWDLHSPQSGREKTQSTYRGGGWGRIFFDASTPRCQVLSAKAMARLGARVGEREVALK